MKLLKKMCSIEEHSGLGFSLLGFFEECAGVSGESKRDRIQ